MTDTSRKSYREIVESGFVTNAQLSVLKAIAEQAPISQRAACQASGLALNSGTPRFAELRHNGLIHVVGQGKCAVTGKTVDLYDLTHHVPTEKLKKPPGELTLLRDEVAELKQANAKLSQQLDHSQRELLKYRPPPPPPIHSSLPLSAS